MQRKFIILVLLLVAGKSAAAADFVARMEWNVEGVTREALVYVPAAARPPTPVVFAFHGHGGTMKNAAAHFGCHRLWPEAIAVYMQGLNTPGTLTDPKRTRPAGRRPLATRATAT